MIITSRRFLPFFATQALGAFNDNFYRNGLVMLITFAFAAQLGDATGSIVALCPMIFIAPYFLFSATAGHMADYFDKAVLVRWLKLSELLIMLLAALGFFLMQLWLLLIVLFLMGTQSAFFGPVKYAIMPSLLTRDKLLIGNAWVEASTFIVILGGTLAASLLMLDESGRDWLSLGCVALSVLGIASAGFIPRVPPVNPPAVFRFNIAIDTFRVLKSGLRNAVLRYPMLGISWFWSVGTTYVAQIPFYSKDILGDAEGTLVPWLLLAFTVGIAAGAFLCAAIQRGRIVDNTVLPGALLMAVLALDLYLTGVPAGDAFPWRVICDLAGIAVGAGLFVVPLYAMLQHHASHEARGKAIAANNILDALLISLVSLINAGLLAQGVSIATIFLAFGLLSPLMWWLARRV